MLAQIWDLIKVNLTSTVEISSSYSYVHSYVVAIHSKRLAYIILPQSDT